MSQWKCEHGIWHDNWQRQEPCVDCRNKTGDLIAAITKPTSAQESDYQLNYINQEVAITGVELVGENKHHVVVYLWINGQRVEVIREVVDTTEPTAISHHVTGSGIMAIADRSEAVEPC